MKKLIIAGLLGIFLCSIIGMAQDRWSKFDPEPLSILSPGEKSISNPPFFHWQHVENTEFYTIELVGLDIAKEWETSWNFYTQDKTLENGFYSLIITAHDSDGNILKHSKEKEFRISDNSVGFEADWSPLQFPAGTRYFITDEHLEEIKNAEGHVSGYRDRLLELARKADVQDILNLSEPDEYEGGIWDHSQWNVINNTAGRIDTFMQRQVMAYLLTEDEKFAQNAVAAMDHVAQWNPTGSTGVWSSDHSAQSMLHALSIGYSTFQDMMEPESRNAVKQNIFERSADMYRFLNPFLPKETAAGMMNDPDNNHPWFCAGALANGAMALMEEVPQASEWLSFTAQMFHGVFLPRGDSTGGWHEGIDYWSYMLYYVMQFAHSLNVVQTVDLFNHPWLENTAHFKIAVHPPVGAYVPFGSCLHNPPNHFDKLVMIKLASVYQEPVMWKYIDNIDNPMHDSRLYFALLWYDRQVTEIEEVDIPEYFHFEDMGWAVAVSDIFEAGEQVLFAMRSGPFFGRRFNHSQADQNHFVITAGGDKLIWDAGYYDGYLTEHHRQFTVQSIAHNVPLFDGEGQVVFTPGADGKITRFEVDGDRLVVEGDASEPVIYGGRAVKFIRTITMDNFREFVIEDDIQADHLRQISWLLQSAYPIHYEQETGKIRIKGDNYQVVGSFETDESLEAILRDTFPVQPRRTEARPFPEQYRLELRTTDKIEFWTPRLILEIKPLEK